MKAPADLSLETSALWIMPNSSFISSAYQWRLRIPSAHYALLTEICVVLQACLTRVSRALPPVQRLHKDSDAEVENMQSWRGLLLFLARPNVRQNKFYVQVDPLVMADLRLTLAHTVLSLHQKYLALRGRDTDTPALKKEEVCQHDVWLS